MSTYTPIASQTLSSATAGVTFSSIPQYYTDLVLVVSGNTTAGPTDNNMQFNNDTGSNYGATMLFGSSSGSSSALTTATNLEVGGIYWATGRGSRTVHIMNYANPNVFKNVLAQASSDTLVNFRAGTWKNTAPITSIYVFVGASTYVAGTTFNLYGIQEGGGYALGGDIVTTDGTYWYHTFLSSGAFTPTKSLTVDYLVVAGGGGGGTLSNGGGGGAGGLRSTVTATGGGGSLETPLSLAAQAYTVTVGAGGASNTSGVNSTFATITSTGGGYGEKSGGFTLGAGNGGSGGGTGYFSSAKGLGTSGQGFDGGTSNSISGVYGSGGGGGAGAVGQNGTNTKGGDGGAGVAVSISGSSVYYAGGGGGSADGGTQPVGGVGGGGNGTPGTVTNGAANTGGGAGADRNSTGVNGGSGIVIVRYAV
jgi:hypothetical protein